MELAPQAQAGGGAKGARRKLQIFGALPRKRPLANFFFCKTGKIQYLGAPRASKMHGLCPWPSEPVVASRFFQVSGPPPATNLVTGEFGENGYKHVGV